MCIRRRWTVISGSDEELRARMERKLKEDIFKAQRMYYLSQKLNDRIPAYLKQFSKVVLNQYIKLGKDMNLQLTGEELFNRLFKD